MVPVTVKPVAVCETAVFWRMRMMVPSRVKLTGKVCVWEVPLESVKLTVRVPLYIPDAALGLLVTWAVKVALDAGSIWDAGTGEPIEARTTGEPTVKEKVGE